VTWLCKRFNVTPSGFYAWRARGVSAHAIQDRRLTTAIVGPFSLHHERYGSPRIHRALEHAGWTVSRRHVARLMAAAGLRAKAVRGYRAKAAIHQQYARHPNLLWTTHVTTTNQVWVGDITYFKIAGCWWYLAMVMDQFSRRILAWSLTRRRISAVTCAVPRGTTRTPSRSGTHSKPS
jgi:putative transposase